MLLPVVPGRFPVGATSFSKFYPNLAIGSTNLRPTNPTAPVEPALQLEEIAFTAFYPAEIAGTGRSRSRTKGLDWVVRPIENSLLGYAKFTDVSRWILWPVLYLFGAFIKIPVFRHSPLLNPSARLSEKHESHASSENQWPLVIFSHGLGGGRTMYSQLCSRVASSGRVVLAIEHRDGTAPVCVPRYRGNDGITQKRKLYIKDDDVIFNSGDLSSQAETGSFPLRTDQLNFRRHEIYLAYDAFKRLVSGEERLQVIDGSAVDIDWESWSRRHPTSSRTPVKCEQIALVGHSFGGATMFSVLSTGPPVDDLPPLPVSQAIALDPWLEPLPTPGPAPYTVASSITNLLGKDSAPCSTSSELDETVVKVVSTRDSSEKHEGEWQPSRPRMMVINSEKFSLWEPHFSRLKDVMRGWEPESRNLFTLVKSKHESFSDFYVLPLIRTAAAAKLVDVVGTLCLAFLDGNLENGLERLITRKMAVVVAGKKKDGRPNRVLLGDVGDVIVH